jgi:GT2 family glycosyltransferase
LSPNETYPQHVVTAVIVAHDGAVWLPQIIESLLDQTRPVQRVVAVDTGSRDRSGAVLSGLLGQAVVFGMDRGTGYGPAVARALQHREASVSIPAAADLPASERVEWIWLLHDDCEPAPDALEQLLRGAAETRSAAVLGPKVMDWADRKVILEAGVTIDMAGRRITGIEPREVDQGQHDGDRDALAVGSAGMLVRRDVWDQAGGFDQSMALFREDVDFCWRVHAAGYRVRVITDAVVYHVEASARRRRPVSAAGRPRQQDRRNAMFTLLSNLPAVPMLASLAGNVVVSALRTIFFLLAKRPAAGLDELGALGSVFGHPIQLIRARRLRSGGRRAAYGRLRADLPPGHSARRIAEFAAAAMSRSAQVDTAGSHHATDDPADDDFLLVDTGLAQRILTHPGVALFLGLTVVALVAERSLLGGGPLGGGSLVPAWGGVSGLWHEYLQGFHPAGIGSGSTAPPYVAIVAVLATAAGGKPWLAVDVLLLGCVPLAGAFAYLAIRKVAHSALVRVWAAAAYALLPIAMGAIAAGRLGTAVVFVLIPLIALLAGRIFTEPPRRARRAAWATGLTIAIAAAFVPLTWIVAVLAAAVTAVVVGIGRPSIARNLGIVAATPPVLLLPWTIQIAAHPAQLLLEVGIQRPGLASPDLPARSLLLLSPGGPGLPPVWVMAGLGVAGVAALLVARRRALAIAGWAAALFGLLVAVVVSRMLVQPAGGGPVVPAWPGIALAIVGAGLVLAVASAGDALPGLAGRAAGNVAGRGDGGAGTAAGAGKAGGLGRRAGKARGIGAARGIGVAVLAVVACSAPVLSAAYWLVHGVSGPLTPTAAPVVPVLVSASSGGGLQLRTLVLRSAGGQVSYSLERGIGPSFGESELTPVGGAQRALDSVVATLVAPDGGEADDQGQTLAQFDVGYVLLPAPVDQNLARVLDGVAGLRLVTAASSTASFDLWRLVDVPARVRVAEPDGAVVALPSGQTSVSRAAAPAAGGTLELAEPAGGWSATLNGRPLTQVASPAGAWAQAFRLPPGGGVLDISRDETSHDLVLVLEALLVIVVAVLALPGARAAAADGAHSAAHGAGPNAGLEQDAGAPSESPASRSGRRVARLRNGAPAGRPGRGQRQRRDRARRPRRAGQPAALAASAGATAGLSDQASRPDSRPAGPAEPRSAGEPADRPLDAPSGRPASRSSAPVPGPLPVGPSGAAPGLSPDWPGNDQRSDWPSGAQRSDWVAAEQQSGWQGGAQQHPGWPSGAEQHPGRPGGGNQLPSWQNGGDLASEPVHSVPPGWPSGRGGALDPLPQLDPLPEADGTPPWSGSAAAGDVPLPRWPVPDRDTGGDDW